MANAVFVSAASAMEVTTKSRLGKLPEAEELSVNFETVLKTEGLRQMPVSVRHAAFAGSLGIAHRDPFDRLLAAQAILENAVLASNESLFDAFGVPRLW